ncbi:MAG: class I SAM-dependent methyltransferase [Bacteroidales bacterium]|nr:class I SAM-dependent methyltransferase [Bacteroidales bacterium]
MSREEIGKHYKEIRKNRLYWQNKPVLQTIYGEFYKQIRSHIDFDLPGLIVEMGSGTGNIKMVIPQVVTTDIFGDPLIDQVENAYNLTFMDNSVSNLILFDVFHHIEYPGTALAEFHRVLVQEGRVIIFDPAMSLAGLFVYGLFHHEPLAVFRDISWYAPENFDPWRSKYYAAQSSSEKAFFTKKYKDHLKDWEVVFRKKYSATAYILSGGYSKPQLFPDKLYKTLTSIEKALDLLPCLFGTRSLVVLRRKSSQL